MSKYPKMQTLWKRDAENKYNIMEGHFSKEEFENIEMWHITEKIDGMNIRVIFNNDVNESIGAELTFGGRTDKAQLPTFMFTYLQKTFNVEMFQKVFEGAEKVILYGEGYGAGIRKGGKYRKDNAFILFAIWIDGWWLKPDDVEEIAIDLGIDYVPFLGIMTKRQAVDYLKSKPKSKIGEEEFVMEGIVAQSEPLMLFRNGKPMMWKLKVKDYERLEE
jgi:hypothetical protein